MNPRTNIELNIRLVLREPHSPEVVRETMQEHLLEYCRGVRVVDVTLPMAHGDARPTDARPTGD